MNVTNHKKAFDELYSKLTIAEGEEQIVFPLVEIDRILRNDPVGATTSYFYRRFSVHILSRLALEDELSVLVVGCGMGFDEKNIKHLYPGSNLWSIDISKEMIDRAVKGGSPGRYSLSLAEKLPFPDNCFDRVLSREVIEHVIDPQKMLKEICRVLKPQGIAVITTENQDAIGVRYYCDRIRTKIADFIKYRVPVVPYKDEPPTLSEMIEYADKAELTILETFYDGALYKIMNALSSMIKSKHIIPVAHYFSCLENNRYFARFFCDQVKYILMNKEMNINSVISDPFYACIKCKNELERSEVIHECPSCGAKYPVTDGVPNFVPVDNSMNNVIEHNESIINKSPSLREIIGKALYHVLDKIVSFSYLSIYLFLAILCTSVPKKNKERLSHILKENDPFHKYLTVNKINDR